MILPNRLFILCCAILAAVIAYPSNTFSNGQPITIAVLPCANVVKTFERFQPLADYLAKATGYNIETLFPHDEQEMETMLRDKKADFIFHNPYSYKNIAETIDKTSLLKAIAPDGTDMQSGVLIVRKDSGLKKITDLKNKKVIFGMECSANRWTAGKKLFADHGMDIDKDLFLSSFDGCCEEICFNVYLKGADAGLICNHYFEEQQMQNAKHIKELAVIATIGDIPTRIFAARKDVDPEIITKVRNALLAMNRSNPEQLQIMELTDIFGFIEADYSFYEKISR